MSDILEVSSLCSAAVTMPIIDITSSMICEYHHDHAARIVGRSMQTISQREAMEWADKINLGLWTKKCVEKWSWLPEVLEGLLSLAQAKLVTLHSKPFPTDYCIPVLHRDKYPSLKSIHFCRHLFCLIQGVFDWLASASLIAS